MCTMSQNSWSPTRKSKRQTGIVGKAQNLTTDVPAVENVVAAVEHTFLAMQHVMDPNSTSRPTRQKRAVTPSLSAPNLDTRLVPVLTPSVSERHAGEETEDAEAVSTYESTTSKRLRSPTRRMVDLHITRKPVVHKLATSSTDVSQDVRALYKVIRALAQRSKGVIPLGIEV